MKNVMKKVFSLLLVGVVAVSMFGFITPNRIDAAETNATEFLTIRNATPKVLRYRIDFYLAEGPEKTKPLNRNHIIVTLRPDEHKNVSIPPLADYVYFKTILLDKNSTTGELYQEHVFARPFLHTIEDITIPSLFIHCLRDIRSPIFKQRICPDCRNSFEWLSSTTTREGM